MKEAVTQAQYARLRGLSKSYITKLKADDRLVMTDDGLVLVDESDALIAATADPTRADVAERHAEARGTGKSSASAGSHYQNSRAIKAQYDALQAKITYERDIGELIPRAQIAKVVADALSTLNSALDNMATRLPSLVVGVPDIEMVRARVLEEIEQYRLTVSRQFRDLAERARKGDSA